MTDTNVNIIRLTAAETAAKIASGELTAVQVTEAHLARIEAVDEKVHAFLHVDREGALAQARAVDAKRERGRSSVRWPAYPSRSRTSSPPRAFRPPSGPRCSKGGSRRTTRPSPSG